VSARTAYVAGRFGDWEHVRAAQTTLRLQGYRILHDWTVHADAGDNERDGSIPVEQMAASAQADLDAALCADLFVLVCRRDMADALGCYVELGAALSAAREVHVIAPARPSIFFCLPTVEVFPTPDAWAVRIREREAA
jgi:hypothetical protein